MKFISLHNTVIYKMASVCLHHKRLMMKTKSRENVGRRDALQERIPCHRAKRCATLSRAVFNCVSNSKISERRQGKRYRFSLRWKELWLKDNGRWQVVASQATPVNPTWDAGFAIK